MKPNGFIRFLFGWKGRWDSNGSSISISQNPSDYKNYPNFRRPINIAEIFQHFNPCIRLPNQVWNNDNGI